MAFSNSSKRGLKIIIVGCGKVGRTLVDRLSKEGHDIVVIDENQDRIDNLTNLYDIMGIQGNGASYSTQVEAGINDADLIIAVTNSDELNLLCCTIAKQMGDCASIARVRNPDYSKEISYLQEKLGLVMIINPELEAAREISSILSLPSTLEVSSFAHGQAEMVEFKIEEGNVLDGLAIKDLHRTISSKVLITAVKRGSEVIIPTGDFVLQTNDIVCAVGARRFARTFLSEIGFKTRQVKNCLIVGGGKASYYLAKLLLQARIDVSIIERSKERCEELSIALPKATIINGDGGDESLLREEGIEYIESFVPLTGIDEENIILTLYANQVSNAKVVTKVNRINFDNVLSQLNLGSVVYPRHITAESIIAYVRAKSASGDGNDILTLYHLFDQKVEAIEFNINEKSAAVGVPFSVLKFKDNVLIAFINRNGTIIIPSGSDTIEVGDTVMVVTTHTGFGNIKDTLR
ncbi:MAG: Trk system potassium transporter TrkA [Pseudobutyrivibrio sp.]|jgi:trk system potassium uptake protein TrkA|uniref:Trk system potassium uptake protein TrkA n=3 Tax=Pseudobutyrivibrio TaxID=46205 RepID=A0A2G3DYJ1_9FIRM|nr:MULTISPECIES: Trk system potassium transporter TrkA [Pseudobutyrivibrio]MBE5904070.1 Trk system potassium transporter TrkA [Pseudobutyrivibrio sp.]NEX00522.1 Trk system potassium transporter TrkA [Pseudobutyrivibrio xylanivorans]PHU36096.1 Trk system potassium transporter TrkA [Pseudobutyrivibrio ruminis]SFR60552.1 trk system potassium uptake protein TrkA [Pseudobutyrivibrio sp. NOR37]